MEYQDLHVKEKVNKRGIVSDLYIRRFADGSQKWHTVIQQTSKNTERQSANEHWGNSFRESLANDFKSKNEDLFVTQNSYTYIMYDGRHFKIGKAKNPHKRLKELQTANPEISLITYTDKVTEKFLHKLFALKKVRLEWFNLDRNDLIKIEGLIKEGITERVVCDLHFKKHTSNRIKISEKYIIPFGKYRGTKITDMVNPEQIEYCEWILTEMDKYSKNAKRKSAKYKAFRWWVDNYDTYSKGQGISSNNFIAFHDKTPSRKNTIGNIQSLTKTIKNTEIKDFEDLVHLKTNRLLSKSVKTSVKFLTVND